VPLVIAVTFVYGLAGTAITGAQTAPLKNLVPAVPLADANDLQQTLQQVMRLVTPALGIGLVAVRRPHRRDGRYPHFPGRRVPGFRPDPEAGERRPGRAQNRAICTQPQPLSSAIAVTPIRQA
jgi:hypothetical protein